MLATLAEALAATGQPRDAAQAWDVAIAVATESGDTALAADLRRRRASAWPLANRRSGTPYDTKGGSVEPPFVCVRSGRSRALAPSP